MLKSTIPAAVFDKSYRIYLTVIPYSWVFLRGAYFVNFANESN